MSPSKRGRSDGIQRTCYWASQCLATTTPGLLFSSRPRPTRTAVRSVTRRDESASVRMQTDRTTSSDGSSSRRLSRQPLPSHRGPNSSTPVGSTQLRIRWEGTACRPALARLVCPTEWVRRKVCVRDDPLKSSLGMCRSLSPVAAQVIFPVTPMRILGPRNRSRAEPGQSGPGRLLRLDCASSPQTASVAYWMM